MLILISCVDKNYGIVKQDKLPCYLNEYISNIRKIVDNQTLLMDYNTFNIFSNSFIKSKYILLSNNSNLFVPNVNVIDDWQKIILMSKTSNIYIMGDKQLYDLFINYVDQLILIQFHGQHNCDVFWKPNFLLFNKPKVNKNKLFNIFYYSKNFKILNGNLVYNEQIQNLIKIKNELLNKYHIVPKLVVISAFENKANDIYIKNKIKTANQLGIDILNLHYDSMDETKLIKLINNLNNDKSVHGILVQLPLKNIDYNIISNTISEHKDVDCFNYKNISKLILTKTFDHNLIYPCTPIGIINLLQYYNIKIQNKNIVIMGTSNIVGKPLIYMLLTLGATVHVVNSKTINPKKITKQADILIVAIGKPNLINSSYIKSNAIVIDVGINYVNNKIVGDVNLKQCIKKVKMISPVPGGVGKMTLIMLFNNLLNLYKQQMNRK